MGPMQHDATRSSARGGLGRAMGIAALVALAALTSSCTTVSRSSADALRLIFVPKPSATPAQVAAVRFPQLQLRAPDVNGVLVLGYVDGGRQAWIAGGDAVFYLQPNGLVTATSGIGRSYTARITGPSPFDDLGALQGTARVQRQYDWIPSYQMGVPVTGTLSKVGTEKVVILERPLSLARYEEKLSGPGFRETNIYWVDERSGFIWKSRQYLAPGYAVDIEQLKPYRPGQ